jgi:2-keto-4-pentenoate hydratase
MTTDERIVRGMRRQLDLRDTRLAAGARQVGWKVGFGSPSALALLRIDRPLVGFLLDTGMLADEAVVSLDGWRNPMLEAEIAVHIDDHGAISGVSAAIELADVAPPPQDPEPILAGDIFTRHVVLGPVVAGRTDSRGVVARILADDAEVASTDDVTTLVGELGDVVRTTAAVLADHGERLRGGQFVMTGSVFPPLAVTRGQRVLVDMPPLGRLSVSFS